MVRFAPRYGIISPCLARPVQARHLRAMNDNAGARTGSRHEDDAALDTALRLFAAHGFSAAERARDAVLIAQVSEDAARAEFWLDVCRTLDRRMARDVVMRHGS